MFLPALHFPLCNNRGSASEGAMRWRWKWMSVRESLERRRRLREGGWSNRNQICADRSVGRSVGRSGKATLSPFNGIYRAQHSGRNVSTPTCIRVETGLARAYLCIQKYINRDHKSLSIGSSTASNSTEIVPAQALGLQSPLLTLSGMNQQSGWLHY